MVSVKQHAVMSSGRVRYSTSQAQQMEKCRESQVCLLAHVLTLVAVVNPSELLNFPLFIDRLLHFL